MKIGLYCRDLDRPDGMAKATVLAAKAWRLQGHEVEVLVERTSPRLASWFGEGARGLRVLRAPASSALPAKTAAYDLFVNQLPGAYFPSLAPRSWLWVHAVPKAAPRWLEQYRVFGNSEYTAAKIRGRWRARSEVLLPPVAVGDFAPRTKERLILAVGTLGARARPKRELELIRSFAQLRRRGELDGWRLHVAGALEGGPAWLRRLRAEAKGAPVTIRTDAGLRKLRSLYGRASLFWHGCRDEHFGIALVEAMAAGCVPLAPRRGGPLEIVEHGKSGWLYGSTRELERLTLAAAGESFPLARMAAAARRRSRRYAAEVFGRRLRALTARTR